MTVIELYKELDRLIPRSLSCEWDNDGLMCCPEPAREARKILIALDVTSKTVDAAIEGGYDLIVSHHPLIFKGLKSINDESFVADKAIKLIKSGISVFSFHTRLDAVSGGVNDTLASLIGLDDVSAFGDEGIGRIGTLTEQMSATELAAKIKTLLGAEGVLVSDCGKTALRVAVLGGGGEDDIGAAMAAGADTYVSGRLGYHQMTDAPDMGINLIEAGHFYTENPICPVLKEMIERICPTANCDLFFSNTVRLI